MRRPVGEESGLDIGKTALVFSGYTEGAKCIYAVETMTIRILAVVWWAALCMSAMDLTSPAFQNGGNIPVQYTCDGGEASPPLAWSGAPAGTQALALVVEDPDSPSGVFTHWVVWAIPATVDKLPENASKAGLPDGAMQGRNNTGRVGWLGPCPPDGTHHYLFHLYAINVTPQLKPGAERSDVDNVDRGHVIAETTLTGVYSHQQK
jgi:Raf kinase inhibitor-like YbhB/YbcL family protein